MASSVVDIYNMALNSVGARNTVSSPTENSREAETCSLWYASVRDQVFSSARWPTARQFARLSLLVERDFDVDWVVGDPEASWRYAYAYPSNMLRPRYLSDFSRFDVGLYNNTTRAIFTNTETPILAYTARQENVQLWGPELELAIATALAAFIALPLTGKMQRAIALRDLANSLITTARVNQANETNDVYESIPEWITARGYSVSTSASRYMYPDGPSISIPVSASGT